MASCSASSSGSSGIPSFANFSLSSFSRPSTISSTSSHYSSPGESPSGDSTPLSPVHKTHFPSSPEIHYPDRDRATNVTELGDGPFGFELLVIGCGGGPLETNLSSYLLKPYAAKWSEGCTSLEAGSGLGALANLVENSPDSFTDFGLDDLGIGPSAQTWPGSVGREGGGRAAGRIWDYIRCFTVSHAHLDHIQGLVISSGASLIPRPLYGLPRTLANIDRLFDGGIWPRLAGWESDGVMAGRAYLYREISIPSPKSAPLSSSLSFTALPISHGLDPSNFYACKRQSMKEHPEVPIECYDSTAFFIKEDMSGLDKELLFFGDVEPDSLSKRPLNRVVWEAAAPKIAARTLGAIFLECSYPASQPNDKLWGHLSPPFVLEELKVLAELVIKARRALGMASIAATRLPLGGVTVVIVHVKDDILSLRPPPPPVSASTSGCSTPLLDEAPPAIEITPALPLAPLTMSPPVPSLPTRRASGGQMPNVGWGFSRKNSISPSMLPLDVGGTRRMSVPQNMYEGVHQPTPSTRSSTSTGLDRLLATFSSSSSKKKKAEEQQRLESMTEVSEGSVSPGASPTPGFVASPVMMQDHESAQDEEDETVEETVKERIERELNELEEIARTGVRFLMAEQGMRLAF